MTSRRNRAWLLAVPLVAWLGGGCVSERAGHEQSLELRLDGALPAEVKSARLVIGAAELLPCAGYAGATGRSLPERVADWLVPTAHAHSETGALRIGAPRVLELQPAADLRVELGRFFAPEGRYCRVSIELSPADADAAGLAIDGGVGDTLVVDFHGGRESLHSAGEIVRDVGLPRPMEVAGQPQQQVIELVLALGRVPLGSLGDPQLALIGFSSAFGAP